MNTTTVTTSDNAASAIPSSGILGPISVLFAAIAKRREEKKIRALMVRDLNYLREQPEHMLKDIGLTQMQVWDEGIGLDLLKSGRR